MAPPGDPQRPVRQAQPRAPSGTRGRATSCACMSRRRAGVPAGRGCPGCPPGVSWLYGPGNATTGATVSRRGGLLRYSTGGDARGGDAPVPRSRPRLGRLGAAAGPRCAPRAHDRPPRPRRDGEYERASGPDPQAGTVRHPTRSTYLTGAARAARPRPRALARRRPSSTRSPLGRRCSSPPPAEGEAGREHGGPDEHQAPPDRRRDVDAHRDTAATTASAARPRPRSAWCRAPSWPSRSWPTAPRSPRPRRRYRVQHDDGSDAHGDKHPELDPRDAIVHYGHQGADGVIGARASARGARSRGAPGRRP
jgi:hypothetical protein